MTILSEASKKRKIDEISVLPGDELLIDSRPSAAPLSPPIKKPRVESLVELVQKGDYDALESASSASINELRGGYSALHYAVFQGNVKMIELLISRGADLNVRNTAGYTPLAWAIERGHTEIVRVLIEHGASVAERDNRSFTALHAASVSGRIDIVHLILSRAKPDLNQPTDDGETPLMLAVAEGHADIVQLLLAAGADPNKGSPLVRAVSKNNAAVVGALLENAAIDVNRRDPQTGRTPLHWAAFYDADAAGRRLLADPRTRLDEQDNAGATPALLAAQRGSLIMLALLQDVSPRSVFDQGPSDESLLALLDADIWL